VDEYQLEIRELRRRLAQLQEQEAAPELIDEYESEVRVHTALYEAARSVFAAGEGDRVMRETLTDLGFGDWSIDAAYSFVYDAAMDMPAAGRELAAEIDQTDFAGSLRAASAFGADSAEGS
jgi:hypothetical protein